MKRSLAISFGIHCLVIGSAVLLLGTPPSLEVADVEALPVTLVPVSEFTQVQEGDQKSDLADFAAPVPTQRPPEVAEAENIGNNDVDLKKQDNVKRAEREEQQAALPTPSEAEPDQPSPLEEAPPPIPEPAPRAEPSEGATAPPAEPLPEPTPQSEPTVEPFPMPEAVPTLEPAPAPREDTSEATPEAAQKPDEPEKLVFPDQIPLPNRRPTEPETRVAEAKPAEKPKTDSQTSTPTTSESDDFNVDEIAALLNRTQAQGGGARRAETPAAFGAQDTTSGMQLTQSELDALRGQIQRNWSILAGLDGAEGVRIRIHMKLEPSGAIIGTPEVTATGGSESARRILASGARRAVLKASPFVQLPIEKYNNWSEVIVNFDPSQML